MALDIIARGMAADSIKCVSQDLTEEQKAIARNNIGVSGGSEDLKNAVQVIPQNFTEAQKQQARTNIGAASQGDIEGINNNIANCVQVNAQTFTEEQKTQARTNIGAASQTSLDNDIANCVQIKAQSLTEEQKTQARTNINAACATYGAIGDGATATTGGAIGNSARATSGGAVGIFATAGQGGAVGSSTTAGQGFSGGLRARVGAIGGVYIDAIQLGEGTNNTPKTLQVYDHKVYDSTKDSLYGSYLNDKTPAVIETVWSGTLNNDGSTTITVNTYSQYDYFILYGSTYGQFCNIIPNINGTYGFTKKSESDPRIMAFSFVYTDGSFTWGESGYYVNGNFTFVDKTGTSSFVLYKIEGVKICKA